MYSTSRRIIIASSMSALMVGATALPWVAPTAQAGAQACGGKISEVKVSKSAAPDGRSNGYVATYKVNGKTARAYSLPKGFYAPEESPQSLRKWGIPPKPAVGSEDYADWMSTYGMRIRKSDPISLSCTDSQNSRNVAVGSATTSGSSTSSNWSSRLIHNPMGTSSGVYVIAGTFVIPTYQQGCSVAAGHSTWVGFGGVNTGKLTQAGVDVDYSKSTPSPYLWYEVLPSVETKVGAPAIALGNQLRVYVKFLPSNGQNISQFVIQNESTGAQSTYNQYSTGNQVDFSTGEYIDQRPTDSSGKYKQYGKATTTFWTEESAGLLYADGYASDSITMVQGTNTLGTGTIQTGQGQSRDDWRSCGTAG